MLHFKSTRLHQLLRRALHHCFPVTLWTAKLNLTLSPAWWREDDDWVSSDSVPLAYFDPAYSSASDTPPPFQDWGYPGRVDTIREQTQFSPRSPASSETRTTCEEHFIHQETIRPLLIVPPLLKSDLPVLFIPRVVLHVKELHQVQSRLFLLLLLLRLLAVPGVVLTVIVEQLPVPGTGRHRWITPRLQTF